MHQNSRHHCESEGNHAHACNSLHVFLSIFTIYRLMLPSVPLLCYSIVTIAVASVETRFFPNISVSLRPQRAYQAPCTVRRHAPYFTSPFLGPKKNRGQPRKGLPSISSLLFYSTCA